MKTQEINKRLTKGLLKMGATQVLDTYFTSFSIQTKYGELIVTLSFPRPRDKILTCYSRFTDVEKAKQAVTCNPYSGKWNWCVFSNQYTVKSFTDMVLGDIKRILP